MSSYVPAALCLEHSTCISLETGCQLKIKCVTAFRNLADKTGYYFSSLLKAQNAKRRCAKLTYSTFMYPEILAKIVE